MQFRLQRSDAVAQGDGMGPLDLVIDTGEGQTFYIVEAFLPLIAIAERLCSKEEFGLLVEAIGRFEFNLPIAGSKEVCNILADYLEEKGLPVNALLARNSMPMGLKLSAVFQWGR